MWTVFGDACVGDGGAVGFGHPGGIKTVCGIVAMEGSEACCL